MRVRRLAVAGLLPVTWLILLAGPALAGPNGALTVAPPTAPVGAKVTLTYSAPYAPDQCSPGTVQFSFDGKAIGQKQIPGTPQHCTATVIYTIPASAACGGNHAFKAVFIDNSQNKDTRTAGFIVTCATKSPTPKPTKASPTPTKTLRTQAPATPTPSASVKPSPTRVPTRTATATPAAVPTGAPTFGPPPSQQDTGGGSSAPWLIGGGLLALAGIGAGVGLLAPRGASKPVVATVVAVGLLGGGALAALPTLTAQPDPAIRSSYVTGAGCSLSDLPIFGGYHAYDTRPTLKHFHPDSTSWSSAPEGSRNEEGDTLPGGPSYTLCLRVGREVPHTVRDKSVAGSAPAGAVSCQSGESLLSGGFYYPWGIEGFVGTHPEAPVRWAAATAPEGADDPPISGHVYALCAELPDGVHTYATSTAGSAGATATARCFPGDAVLGGGWSGRSIRGSHPVDGGWAAELGEAGSAYALCYKPSRAFGLHASYVRTASGSGDVDVAASCDGDDAVIGAGWTGGHGWDSLRHFEPGDHGWSVNLVQADGTEASAYVLCARPYVKP
ncbi:MAG: hypothetical protein QOK42_2556 [Frankiaceae bacterium]|jgi:hypothetical protein|nr:hypothetical protein [Frankiaceae bacterium]